MSLKPVWILSQGLFLTGARDWSVFHITRLRFTSGLQWEGSHLQLGLVVTFKTNTVSLLCERFAPAECLVVHVREGEMHSGLNFLTKLHSRSHTFNETLNESVLFYNTLFKTRKHCEEDWLQEL